MEVYNKLPYYAFIAAYKLGLNGIGGYVYTDCGAKVCDGIFIGSLSTATNEMCLDLHNIHLIINLSGSKYTSSREVFEIVMDDAIVTPRTMEKYITLFAAGVKVINEARMAGKNVLIHCAAGINRSATLIGFYLIDHDWNYVSVINALSAANDSRQVPLLTNNSFRYLLRARDSFRRNFDKK